MNEITSQQWRALRESVEADNPEVFEQLLAALVEQRVRDLRARLAIAERRGHVDGHPYLCSAR